MAEDRPKVDFSKLTYYPNAAEPSTAFCDNRSDRKQLRVVVHGRREPELKFDLGFVAAGPGLLRRVREDDRFTVNGRDVSFEEFSRVCKENDLNEADIIAQMGDTVPITLESTPQAASATAEGILRYPPDGHYTANETPGPACTCQPKCPADCKGECGCNACHEAYGDYLSSRQD